MHESSEAGESVACSGNGMKSSRSIKINQGDNRVRMMKPPLLQSGRALQSVLRFGDHVREQ